MIVGRVLYSPLGIKLLEKYRRRMARLVKEGTLERDEANALIARKTAIVYDRRV